MCFASRTDLIQLFGTAYDKNVLNTSQLQGICHETADLWGVDADHDPRRPCRVAHGAQEVEHGRDAHLLAQSRYVLHGWVVRLREEEAEVGGVEDMRHLLWLDQADMASMGFHDVCRARRRRGGTVAVFRHLGPCARGYDRRRRRDIVSVVAITACADNINDLALEVLVAFVRDYAGVALHGLRTGRYNRRIGILLLQAQSDEEGGNLAVGRGAVHDIVDCLAGMLRKKMRWIVHQRLENGFHATRRTVHVKLLQNKVGWKDLEKFKFG